MYRYLVMLILIISISNSVSGGLEGEPIVLEGHQSRVDALAISPDGSQLASGSWDHTIRLWSLPDGTEQVVLEGHRGDVLTLAYSPDGRYLVSGALDFEVLVWDVTTGEHLLTFTGHTRPIRTVIFHPNGGEVLSVGDNGETFQWELLTGDITQTYEGHSQAVLDAAFTGDGTRLITIDRRGEIIVWDVMSGLPLRRVHYRPASKQLAMLDETPVISHVGGVVIQWDAQTLTPQIECGTSIAPINELVTNPLTQQIFAGDVGGNLWLCEADAPAAQLLIQFPDEVTALARYDDLIAVGLGLYEHNIWLLKLDR